MLDLLKNLVMEFEEIRPVDELDRILDEALREYSRESPRLYKVHKDYFDLVLSEADKIEDTLKKLWEKYPSGWLKSLYICWRNKLSKWTNICVRVTTKKEKGGKIGIEAIRIDKFYKPWKWATHYIELETPSKTELEQELEKVLS